MKRSLNKLAVIAIVLSMISLSLVAVPLAANAQVAPAAPVIDVANLVPNSAAAGGITALVAKETGADSIAWVVAKIAIQSLTNSLVHWINSGFQGSPAFVTNLDSSLLKTGDTVAAQFLKQLGTDGAIKSPFQTQVAQAVQQNYLKSTANAGTSSPFSLQHPFTLGNTSTNTAAFLSGDFTQGGWNAWFSAAVHPENNPYGAGILAQQALTSGIASQQSNKLTELNWGKGFGSWRGSCAATGAADSGTAAGKACTKDDDCAGTLACIAGKCAADSSLDTPVSLTSTDNCLAYNIQTPGSVIESQLEKTFGSNIDSLVTADEFNEVIGALMGQLMNHVLGSGGLAGLTQPSGIGSTSTSFIDQATSPSQFASTTQSISTDFINTLDKQGQQVQAYQASWQTINTAALAAQTACTTAGKHSTLAHVVQPVVTASTKALANAAAAITALVKIKGEAQTAVPAGSDPTTYILQASNDYTTLIASGTVPSDSDVSNAQVQSQDTGTSTPVSLYTQMNQLATTACNTGT